MTDKNAHYLYHIRDPNTSSGFGFHGYVGETNDFSRRKKEHFTLLKQGKHPNEKLQKEWNISENGLEMFFIKSGTKDEILLRERLLVPESDRYLNKQTGGGRLRGTSGEDAREQIFKTSSSAKNQTEGKQSKNNKSDKSKADSDSTASGAAGAGAAGAGILGAQVIRTLTLGKVVVVAAVVAAASYGIYKLYKWNKS